MPSDPSQGEGRASTGRFAQIPEPIRAAAGLAATVLDQARNLPTSMTTLPVKVAGIAMQVSLRVQQQYSGLVVKGDELLTQFTRSDDADPPWATFDDDMVEVAASVSEGIGLDTSPGDSTASAAAEVALPPLPGTSRTRPKRASNKMGHAPSAFDLAEDPPAPSTDSPPSASAPSAASAGAKNGQRETEGAPVPGYDAYTLAQLRARLRTFDAATLQDLLAYERGQRARVPYLTLLESRLTPR